MKGTFQTTGEYWQLMLRVFRKPEKWSVFWKQFWKESQKLIIGSLVLVFIVSVAVGGVICLQTANNLESPFIPKYYVGVMARESLVLEFCSTMIALILAGKMGSNIYGIKPGDTLMLLGDQKGLAMLKTDIFQAIIDQAMEGLTK